MSKQIYKITCPACNYNNSTKYISYPEDYEYQVKPKNSRVIHKCNSCGSVFPNKPFLSSELEEFYGDDYQDYARNEGILSFIYSHYIKYCAKLITRKYPNGSFLDYGCGHGYFINELSKHTKESVYGFDPVDYKNPLVFNSIDQFLELGIKFKYIRLNHVIEHLPNFDQFFSNIEKLITDDAIIIGQTPNASHLGFRIFKKFWGPLHYPYHTIIFSKKGLEKLSSRNGYSVKSINSAIAPTGWSLSIENLIKKLLLGYQKRGRLLGYGIILLILCPLSILEMILFRGNTSNINFELIKNHLHK